MSKFLVFLSFFTVHGAFCQGTWKACWNKPVSDESTWDIDQAGSVYLFNNESISKLDTAGKQLLTQSTKSIGRIKKIDAANWLKIAVFSEEQQQICYLDNALGIQPGCIELTDIGITLAENFATSIQTDRIWVFDQLNSELQLITLRSNQRQIVQNLRSLIDIGNVTQLFEYQNTLYLVDNLGQVATFDNFGTFINGFTLGAGYVQAFDKGLLYSTGQQIYATSTDDEEKKELYFQLPDTEEPIERFHLTGKRLFISTNTTFYCFELLD